MQDAITVGATGRRPGSATVTPRGGRGARPGGRPHPAFARRDVLRTGRDRPGTAAWERALELAPNDALVNRWIGGLLAIAVSIERAEEGVAMVERALYELDPLHPPFHWLNLGNALYFAGALCRGGRCAAQDSRPLDGAARDAVGGARPGRRAHAARAEAAEVLRLDPAFSAEAWIANDFTSRETARGVSSPRARPRRAFRSAPQSPRPSRRPTACPNVADRRRASSQ